MSGEDDEVIRVSMTLDDIGALLGRYDAALDAKIEALSKANDEGATVGMNMLSLQGAIGALRFAREELRRQVAAVRLPTEADDTAPERAEEG
jgi:hypothetical protein